MQQTLATAVKCEGISLHQGKQVTMVIKPAPEYHGICFKRTDIGNRDASLIQADYRMVSDTRLCTVLENAHGVSLSTVEHLMAALWGCGIDNALIEIDGPELPIMDGSSEPFVFLLECAGVMEQEAPRRYISVDTPVIVQDGNACAIIQPWDQGFVLDVDIAFDHQAIGQQYYRFDSNLMSFKQMLSRARTFGFLHEVEMLRSAGLARGGSLHNAIVLDDNGIMNQDGLRFNDECVRHKALDCLGDYFLAQYRLNAYVKTSRPGHKLNNLLMRALFAEPGAWHYQDEDEQEQVVTPEHLFGHVDHSTSCVVAAR